MRTLALGGAIQLLKSLKLVHTSTQRNSRLHRRHKLLAKLAAQIQLAQDCSYQSTKTQYIADSEGKMTLVQRSERIQRWWTLFNAHLLHTGNFCLLVIEIKYEKTRAL